MFVFGVILVCIFPHLDWILRYSVSLRIQSECGKMRTRITPNTDTFHAVWVARKKIFFELLVNIANVSMRPNFILIVFFENQSALLVSFEYLCHSFITSSEKEVKERFLSYKDVFLWTHNMKSFGISSYQ